MTTTANPCQLNDRVAGLLGLIWGGVLRRSWLAVCLLTPSLCPALAGGQPFQLPTANRALLSSGEEEKFYVGTAGKPWKTGAFGCVRSEGTQMHEGIDIRSVQRERKGEPADPVLAIADGTVAYFNPKPSLSNYGRYIILRHVLEGMEVFSLYAHLSEIRAGLKAGQAVKVGETLGVMGRSSNTGQAISKERAHLHLELGLRLSESFSSWYKQNFPNQRNDHGEWNGLNLAGIDPAQVFVEQARLGDQFSLLNLVRGQAELCRVLIRANRFSWARRYPMLGVRNPKADTEGVTGYELWLNFNGIPYRFIPRSAAEITGKAETQLLSVNEAEQAVKGAKRLLIKRRGRWELSHRGQQLLDLLTH